MSRDRARLCQPCAVQTSSTCSTYDLLVAKARAPFAAHATPDARRAVDEVRRNAPKSEMRQEPSTLSPSRPQETLALVLYRLHVLPDELQQVIQSCVRFTPAYSTAVLELYWRDKKTCIHRHGDMHTWNVSRLNLEDAPSYRYSELQIPGVLRLPGSRWVSTRLDGCGSSCAVRRPETALWQMDLAFARCCVLFPMCKY